MNKSHASLSRIPTFFDAVGVALLVLPFLSLAALCLSDRAPVPPATFGEPGEFELVTEVCRRQRYRRLPLADLRELSFVGDGDATFELARRTEAGEGVAQDASRAAELYVTAEEQGFDLPPDVEDRIFP